LRTPAGEVTLPLKVTKTGEKKGGGLTSQKNPRENRSKKRLREEKKRCVGEKKILAASRGPFVEGGLTVGVRERGLSIQGFSSASGSCAHLRPKKKLAESQKEGP